MRSYNIAFSLRQCSQEIHVHRGEYSFLNSKSEALNPKFRKYSNQGLDYIYENPRIAGQIRITKAQNSKHLLLEFPSSQRIKRSLF